MSTWIRAASIFGRSAERQTGGVRGGGVEPVQPSRDGGRTQGGEADPLADFREEQAAIDAVTERGEWVHVDLLS